MRKRTCLALALLTAGTALADSKITPPAEAALKTQLADANHAFASDVYGKMAAGTDKNIIFSPASIAIAMAMTWDGARGETEAQMSKVLHLPVLHGDPLEDRRRVLMGTELQGTKDFELRVANRLWPKTGFPIEASFLKAAADGWGAKAQLLDYAKAAEASRVTINTWVRDQTNGKIVDLIPSGALDEHTRLVLTNAIYFKGKWLDEFSKKETQDAPFYVTPEHPVKVPLMHRLGHYGYKEMNDAQIVSIPYKGDALDMVLVIPKARDGLPALEKLLATPGTLEMWLLGQGQPEIDLSLPRWKASYATGLNRLLSDLGMPLAFDADHADFSGIAKPSKTGEVLYISGVFHKAFIDVNEEGTEAAAATGVVMVGKAAAPVPPPIVRADHPFLYMIRDRRTNTVLFMGRTVDPTATGS